MKRLAVLISGQGRNLQALIEGCATGKIPASIAVVISNRANAAGLERARRAGLRTAVLPHMDFSSREQFDAALAAELDVHEPDVIALAGFMRVLTGGFVRRYAGRLINIHPSLLPRHPGLHTHQRVLDEGDRMHGATVHFVTEALDGGPRIIQGEFMVLPQDTGATLAERTMTAVELKIYPQAVTWLARDELVLSGDNVHFRGQPLAAPLRMTDLDEEFKQ